MSAFSRQSPLFFYTKKTQVIYTKRLAVIICPFLPLPAQIPASAASPQTAPSPSFAQSTLPIFATHPVVSTIHRPQLANLPRQRDSEHTSPLVHPDISTPKHSHSTNQPPPKKNNKKYSHFGCARMRLLHRPRARIEPVARGPANRPLLLVQCLGGRTVGHRHFNENWKH